MNRIIHLKKITAAVSSLLILLGLIITTSPLWLDINRFNSLIVSNLTRTLGGTVHIGTLSWGISDGLRLDAADLSLQGSPVVPGNITIPEAHIKIALLPLIHKRIEIKSVMLTEPFVRLNAADIQASSLSENETPLNIDIRHFTVNNGRLVVTEPFTRTGKHTTHRLSNIHIVLKDLGPNHEIKFTTAFQDEKRPGLGEFTARGTFRGLTDAFRIKDPRLHISATLSTLELSAVMPYLKSDRLKKRLSSPVSLNVTYEGNLSDQFTIDGSADLSGIVYSDPSLWEAPLDIRGTRLGFHLDNSTNAPPAGELTLNQGDNTLRMAARLEYRQGKFVIAAPSISGELDLKSIAPLIPWPVLDEAANPWRRILEGGGRLVAEKIEFPEIDPTSPPADFAELCKQTEARIRIHGVALPVLGPVPRIENLSGNAHWKSGVANITALSGYLAGTYVSEINGSVSKLFDAPEIHAKLLGKLNIESVTDPQAQHLLSRVGITDLKGNADLNLNLVLDTAKPESYDLSGNIKLDHFRVKPAGTTAVVNELAAEAVLKPETLEIRRMSGEIVTHPATRDKNNRFHLKLSARLDDWRNAPQLVVKRLSSSPIPLHALPPLIPWEQIGENADMVRRTLNSGGSLTIQKLSLPPIELGKAPQQWMAWASRIDGVVRFNSLDLPKRRALPPLRHLSGKISLADGTLNAAGVTGSLGPLTFPKVDVRVTDFAEKPGMEATIIGPLTISETRDNDITEALKKYGLSHLAGSADIHIRVTFDEKNTVPWTANGRLSLTDVHATTANKAASLENLNGTILLDKTNVLNLTVADLSAQVNNAPFRLNAKLTNGGTPQMTLEAAAYAEKLNLADLNAFIPTMKKIGLAGTLDMNLHADYNAKHPADTRLTGTMKTRGASFILPKKKELQVTAGNSELFFYGDSARINKCSLQINGQAFSVSGDAHTPKSPWINLNVRADDLNLDRLLAPGKQALSAPASQQSQQALPHLPSPAKRQQPQWMQKLKLNFTFAIKKGRLRDQEFQNLFLDATYQNGLIRSGSFQAAMAGGIIAATGSADIRTPGLIRFEVMPDIGAVQLKPFMALLGMKTTSIRGPLTLQGKLTGNTGGMEPIINTLKGDLNLLIGAGRLVNVGPMGQILSKILGITSLKGIVSGQLFNNLASSGIPFQRIQSDLSINSGHIDLTDSLFQSNSLDIAAKGNVDLLRQKLDIDATLEPFGTVDRILNVIPVIGKATGSLTKVYMDIKGPLADPEIHPRLIKGVTEGIKELFKGPSGQ